MGENGFKNMRVYSSQYQVVSQSIIPKRFLQFVVPIVLAEDHVQ